MMKGQGKGVEGRNYLMILVRRKSLRQKKHCKWVRSQEVILNKWHHIAQPRFT